MFKKRVSLTCATCKKPFERQASEFYGRNAFCGMDCLLKARAERMLLHDGRIGLRSAKVLCRSTRTWECEGCGEARPFLLVIHHVDGNRRNNPADGSNWEVVCGNCHTIRHLKMEGGAWVYSSSSLTPRDLIPTLQRPALKKKQAHEQPKKPRSRPARWA